MKKTIVIGTSGYSYKDWVGTVYPEGTKSADFFEHYTAIFSLTELNFSYYAMPSPSVIERICDKAPEGFLFTIKAHKSMTHEIDKNWESQSESFIRGIKPLDERGMLGGILIQLPYSFHYTDENRIYLGKLVKKMDGSPVFLEFRNIEWQRERVYREMEEQNIGCVVTDLPSLSKLPKTEPRITSSAGYFRLHGRNKENWWEGTNTTRYDYLYSDDELKSLVDLIWSMADDSRLLIITFNNHYKGKAVENGIRLREILLEENRSGFSIR
jgi:uncharacterized protein YecE (DUF72 family)